MKVTVNLWVVILVIACIITGLYIFRDKIWKDKIVPVIVNNNDVQAVSDSLNAIILSKDSLIKLRDKQITDINISNALLKVKAREQQRKINLYTKSESRALGDSLSWIYSTRYDLR